MGCGVAGVSDVAADSVSRCSSALFKKPGCDLDGLDSFCPDSFCPAPLGFASDGLSVPVVFVPSNGWRLPGGGVTGRVYQDPVATWPDFDSASTACCLL